MICIPIMGKNRAAALKTVEKCALQADMIELRMDLLPKGTLQELIEKSRAISPSLKIIVTNRSPSQTGKMLPENKAPRSGQMIIEEKNAISDKEIKRVSILKDAVGLGCDYIDCELETAESLRNDLLSIIESHHHRTKLIVSDHNFKTTPSLNALKKLLRNCTNAKADIIKIVTYARRTEDNLPILELTAYARKKEQAIAAFCMGQYGTISRIMAPLLGSCITYASLSRGLESAPGQLTTKEMKDIFRILSVKNLSY